MVAIALLRGVNVGGHNKIKMDGLRALCATLELEHAQTYVQSGNVVFRTSAHDTVKIGPRLENAIQRTFGFHAAVMVRTLDELRGVLSRNPFAGRVGIDPAKLLVTFLGVDPGPEAAARIAAIPYGADRPEELFLDGRELYIHYPNGVGRSKLSPSVVERALGTAGTARNWNTVAKLVEIAEALPSQGSTP